MNNCPENCVNCQWDALEDDDENFDEDGDPIETDEYYAEDFSDTDDEDEDDWSDDDE